MARALFGLLVAGMLGLTGYYAYSSIAREEIPTSAAPAKSSCCSEAHAKKSCCSEGQGEKKCCSESGAASGDCSECPHSKKDGSASDGGCCNDKKEGGCCKDKDKENKPE